MLLKYLFYFAAIFFFKIYSEILFNYDRFFDRHLPKYDSYDYIIVGSGSAGAVAANLKGKVLVIEAGSQGNSFIFNIPIVQPLLQRSRFDWSYVTDSQNNACRALNNNQSHWPMGKIQGGTHRLNNMVYHRGHPSDYESFITREEAQKFFTQHESNAPISTGKFTSAVASAFVDAGKELGFDDFHLMNLTHFNGLRYTQIDRWKTSPNAPEFCLNAMVSRILFDIENPKKAIGVEFQKRGRIHKVYGEKIVLSAGTIGSPRILLNSGIGPKRHLKELGIDLRESLPVGENLQDHVTTGLDLIILNQTVGADIKDLINPFKILDFFWYDGDGPLALAGSDAMGFVNLNNSNDSPDLSFMVIPVGLVSDNGVHLKKIFNIRDDLWQRHFKPLADQTMISILPILLHPKSKGTVRLRSKNFRDPPIINPNYLSHYDDVRHLITAIRILEKLIETPSMQKLGAEINPKPFPGCERFFFDSNIYWECYVRHMTFTMFHPVGTCKIGNYADESTVVLKNFQVKNIENLFVVDGSVLPATTSANPHAVIAMIAQKFVSDMNK